MDAHLFSYGCDLLVVGPTGQHDNTPQPTYHILVSDQRQSVEPGRIHIRDQNVKRFRA
jgi:hypothetical protein